ncbi:MAG TPA: tRNA pseudouridine(38-40) synthase TruA [Burkholderiales bacterium]|nr:tRNA pseudouridine(38-40) synthase TruA [Burkholderiales bacterium]
MAEILINRIALGIEYNGSQFCGWQRQPQRCSVQDALEQALGRLTGSEVAVVAAGRTDAGVHATGQVVHFETAAEWPLTAWVRGVNSFLPDSVSVLWAHPVNSDFHARFSAVSRSYRYILLNRPVRPALKTGMVGWYHKPLDATSMQQAAAYLVGEHDFSSFRAAECQANSPVRIMHRLRVERLDDEIVFELTANAFLQHMVRNIVGALVYIGAGKQSPPWIVELLRQRDRTRAAPTFSADGLYLCHVTYDAAWGLPARDSGTTGVAGAVSRELQPAAI